MITWFAAAIQCHHFHFPAQSCSFRYNCTSLKKDMQLLELVNLFFQPASNDLPMRRRKRAMYNAVLVRLDILYRQLQLTAHYWQIYTQTEWSTGSRTQSLRSAAWPRGRGTPQRVTCVGAGDLYQVKARKARGQRMHARSRASTLTHTKAGRSQIPA